MANHFGLGDIRQRIGYIRVECIPVYDDDSDMHDALA